MLFLLAGIFACPGLAALWVYNHPQWLNAPTTNKGQLLTPPIKLPDTAGKNKWQLILWYPNYCNLKCRKQIDKLGRIRLALGRHLYEVDEILLSPDKTMFSTALNDQLEELNVKIKVGAVSSLPDYPQVYISSPENYLVLAYQLTAKPEHIFHDLKQLLNSTEKKRG